MWKARRSRSSFCHYDYLPTIPSHLPYESLDPTWTLAICERSRCGDLDGANAAYPVGRCLTVVLAPLPDGPSMMRRVLLVAVSVMNEDGY